MELYNRVTIPDIAFGCGIFSRFAEEHRQTGVEASQQETLLRHDYTTAVASAIKAGFRLIDFSTSYGSGTLIRDAIELSGVPRKELYLTGRVSNHAQFGGQVKQEIQRILDEYGTDYVDLLMFHWPVPEHYEATWKTICEAYEAGIARSIGCANCNPHHVEVLLKSGLKPMVNQFEVHPLFTQKDNIRYNQDLGICVEAYTSIARNDDRLMRLPRLHAIARKYGKTPVQVILRWHQQNGCVPVVRAMSPKNQLSNLQIADFSLEADEMKIIDSFNINSRLRYDPDNCDFTIL